MFLHQLRQAANDMFTKRLENIFLQKLNLATKALRHKGKMRSIFSASCLCAFVASLLFCSEAAENFFFMSFERA
jgi:hypothetical protein